MAQNPAHQGAVDEQTETSRDTTNHERRNLFMFVPSLTVFLPSLGQWNLGHRSCRGDRVAPISTTNIINTPLMMGWGHGLGSSWLCRKQDINRGRLS